MLTEIEHAAGWWASQLSRTSPKETAAFKQALIVDLSSRYSGHWFSDDAQRGCAYRCISYDHRMDSSLVRAAQTAGLDANIDMLLVKARWHAMFVNPGLVKVQNTKLFAATAPIVLYTTETHNQAQTQTQTPQTASQLTVVPGFTPRRSSMMDVPASHTRTVTFPTPVMVARTDKDSDAAGSGSGSGCGSGCGSARVLSAVTVHGLAPSLIPNASLSIAPKRSALKGQHHRSKSTSPVSAPLSVRFNPAQQQATYVSTSPSQHVIKPASPPTTTLAAPKTASPTFQLAKPASPPASGSASSSSSSSSSRDASPKAVHHSSHSVDLNSALFADLTLNVKPSARTVTTPPAMTLTVTPPAPAPGSAVTPVSVPVSMPAPLEARSTALASASASASAPAPAPALAPLPTIFSHLSRLNGRSGPSHHVSHSCSFPYNWNLDMNLINQLENTSPTHCPSPSQLSPKSPTSLSLPRLVSHHRGLSTSLLPSALLVV